MAWSSARQESLRRIIQTSSRAHELRSLLDLVLEEVATCIAFTWAAIWLFERETDTWYIARSRGLSSDAAEVRFSKGTAFPCLVGERGTPLRIDDLRQSDGFRRLYPEHFRMSSALYAPMRIVNVPVGVIALYSDRVSAFSDNDLEFLRTVGNHLSIAVSFASLEEKRQRVAVLEERERMAWNLHDGTLQVLSSIKLYAEDAAKSLEESDFRLAQAALQHLADLVAEAVEEMRAAVEHLRRRDSMLEDIAETVSRMKGRLEASAILTQTSLKIAELPAAVSDSLSAICRECVNNILKHSSAGRVRIEVVQASGYTELVVWDDGVGFEGASVPADGREHLGVQLMRERAAQLGGDLQINSHSQSGVEVRCRIPLEYHDLFES